MFRPRIIPVLLLKRKGLVKSTQFKNHQYIGDPINAVKIFNDLKADELVFFRHFSN
jgi:cyclase